MKGINVGYSWGQREPQEDAENTFQSYRSKLFCFIVSNKTRYCHCIYKNLPFSLLITLRHITVICVIIKTFKLFLVLYVVDIVSLHLVTKKFSKSIGKQLFYDY